MKSKSIKVPKIEHIPEEILLEAGLPSVKTLKRWVVAIQRADRLPHSVCYAFVKLLIYGSFKGQTGLEDHVIGLHLDSEIMYGYGSEGVFKGSLLEYSKKRWYFVLHDMARSRFEIPVTIEVLLS